jgi:two-component system, cell cycle response regulator DivK
MSQQTILYVEDNEYNRKIVRQLVSRTSYRLIEAPDGEAGLAVAREELPNLILMDVQLPKMSGLEATRALKADTRTSHIPVIVITSFALSGDKEKATEAGATGYIAKPYSPRELLALVRRYLPDAGPEDAGAST